MLRGTGSPKDHTEMGRLVADAGKRDFDGSTAEYGAMLMEGLSVRSPERSEGMGTRGEHVNSRRDQHLKRYPAPEGVVKMRQQVYLHPYPRNSCCETMCRQ